MRPPGQPLLLNARTHLGAEPSGGSGVQRYEVAENGYTYCVKLKGNLQGIRVLFNDYLSGRIGEVLGIPVAETALILVPDLLLPRSEPRVPNPAPGTQFAARRYEDAQNDQQGLRNVRNFADFCGVTVFDTFIARGDSRQNFVYPSTGVAGDSRDLGAIYDQGHSFTGSPVWDVRSLNLAQDCPVRDDLQMKLHFANIEAYDCYLEKLERLQRAEIEALVHEAPLAEWQVEEVDAAALIDWLDRRKTQVRGAIQNHLR